MIKWNQFRPASYLDTIIIQQGGTLLYLSRNVVRILYMYGLVIIQNYYYDYMYKNLAVGPGEWECYIIL